MWPDCSELPPRMHPPGFGRLKVVKCSPYGSVVVLWPFADISVLAPIGRHSRRPFGFCQCTPSSQGAFRRFSYRQRLLAPGRNPSHHRLLSHLRTLARDGPAGVSPASGRPVICTGCAAFPRPPEVESHHLSLRTGLPVISSRQPCPYRTPPLAHRCPSPRVGAAMSRAWMS